MQCEFEGAGQKLAGKIYGQQAWTVIDHLEARHRGRSPTMAMRASCPWVSEFARAKRGFFDSLNVLRQRLVRKAARSDAASQSAARKSWTSCFRRRHAAGHGGLRRGADYGAGSGFR